MASSSVTVREATQNDITSLVVFQYAMAEETEGKTLDFDLLRKGVEAVFRSSGKGFYVVAESDQRVVGSLLITDEWSDWRNATFWWIQSVYVEPQWRRRRVYQAMHEYVRRVAESREDICGIRLYVERNNFVAQKTYASLGMSESSYNMYEIDLQSSE